MKNPAHVRRATRLRRPLGASIAAALALLAMPVRTLAETPIFGPVTTTSTNSSFHGLAGATTGDFNGDGKLDAFAIDNGAVRMMLGLGTGGFIERDLGIPGAGPIRAADLNGDGRLDFIFGRGQGDLKPVVLLNSGNDVNGTPQFSSTSYAPFGGGIRSLTIGDLTGDGRPDFIVGNAYGGLWVYVNNGDGTFTSGQTTNLLPGIGGPSVAAGAIGDLNGDGRNDFLVTSNQNGAMNLFFGNGDGTLQSPVIIQNSVVSVALGDLNGDGRTDFVTGNGPGGTVRVFLNTGGGTFAAPVSYVAVPNGAISDVAIADMNGDGTPDIAALSIHNNTGFQGAAVLEGVGDGTFDPGVTFSINRLPLHLSTGDFNGDGKPDIGALGLYDKTYGVILNITEFAPPPELYFTDALIGPESPNLIGPDDKYAYSPTGGVRINNSTGGGDASSNNDRPVISTASGGYLALEQFRATVTVNLTTPDLAYFGFGRTLPDPNYFNEPAPSFLFRIHRNWTGSSSVQAWATQFGSSVNNPDHFFGFASGRGNYGNYLGGPLTLEILRDGDSLTFSVPAWNQSYTFSISQYADAMGLNSTNTRIFFGGTNNGSVFSNLVIAPLPTDTTPPVITVPADITTEATSPAGANVTFSVTATDDTDGSVPVVVEPASGSTFPLGTTVVDAGAADAAGNEAFKSFNVTVQDTTAPVLSVPANLTAEATSAAGAVVSYPAATATDAVGVTSITYSKASGSTFALGTTSVGVTASDAAGNTSNRSFSVTVKDTTPPVITSLTPSTGTLWPANHKMVAVTLAVSASDAVGATSYKIVNATSSEPDNGLGDGDTAGDIAITGDLTLNLRAERSGSGSGRTYTITVQASDAAGNTSTQTVTVSVPKSMGKN